MSERIDTIKEFANLAFGRLDRATKDITDKELDWRPCPEANSPRWIMTHLAQEWNVYIPKIMKGDPDYKPPGWPEDYVDNKGYKLEKIKADMENGKKMLLEGLEGLTPEKAAEEIPLFGGTRRRDAGLLMFISEVIHHEGQLATTMGTYKRQAEKS
ncbi:MAG TPA: DinB family protein [Patescibacteria group bacterium]|nr:DinB family protein [Patescibacteria group bacterium]